MARLDDLFKIMVEEGASDMHLSAGSPPLLRLHGDMIPIQNQPEMDSQYIQDMVFEIIRPKDGPVSPLYIFQGGFCEIHHYYYDIGPLPSRKSQSPKGNIGKSHTGV